MNLVECINECSQRKQASTDSAPPPINPGGPVANGSKPAASGWLSVLGKIVLQFAPKDWTPAQLGNGNNKAP